MTLSNRPISVQHLYALERLVRAQEARASLAWVWTAESAVTLGSTPVRIALPLVRDERHVVRLVLESAGAASGTVTLRAGGWTGTYEVSVTSASRWIAEVPSIWPAHAVTAEYAGTGTVRLRHVAISAPLLASYPVGQFVPADAALFGGLDARLAAAYRRARAGSGWCGSAAVSVGLLATPLWRTGKVAGGRWNVTLAGTRTAGSDLTTAISAAASRINDPGGTGYAASLTVDVDDPKATVLRAGGDAATVTVTDALAAVSNPNGITPQEYLPGTQVSASALASTYSAAAALLPVPGVALAAPGGTVYSLTGTDAPIGYGVAPPCADTGTEGHARIEIAVENLTSSSATVTVTAATGKYSLSVSITLAAGATGTATATGTLDTSAVVTVGAKAAVAGNYRVHAVHVYF